MDIICVHRVFLTPTCSIVRWIQSSAGASAAAAKSSSQGRNLVLGATAATLLLSATAVSVDAKSASVDEAQVRQDIAHLLEVDSSNGPTFVRLAWHQSGTFCKGSSSGGSQGCTIRLQPELGHGANAGLDSAVAKLELVKARNPAISYADLYILAGVTAIEEMGGPVVPFAFGRTDETDGRRCPEEGRLPGADAGSKPSTIQHIRDIFYRMGFSDQEIVALIGAHAVGRCYPSRSGYSGPWTNAEWTFSNEYFRELVENTWTKKKWTGPEQYEDPTGQLMMLPSDMALMWDPAFKTYVEMYAKDEEKWHADFAQAFQKLTENGCQTLAGKSWWSAIFG